MKSYTDVEQSKKLVEFLPIESADMWWVALNWQETEYYVEVKQDGINQPKKAIPCWSLTALLDILPKGKVLIDDIHSNKYKVIGYNLDTDYYDEPLDAVFEMILKLKENNKL